MCDCRPQMIARAGILILPFAMFHWTMPFVSEWTIGMDYTRFSIQQQMELLFSLKTGSFPLYIPGFAGGQSSSALTLGQVFHPLPHIAALLPGYWSGKALEWNTFLRLLSLGAAQLALFTFLQKMKLTGLMAFLISMITVYNLRTLDLFRYGASLESWTGHLFLCAAIGSYWLNPKKCSGPVLIIGSSYWLIVSGHPQMMYYGLLGAGLFALIIPYFSASMPGCPAAGSKAVLRFWLRVGAFLGLGMLLSMAYVLPFYFDFLATNAGRVGRDYAWADGYRDTLVGTVNSFFYPLRSDVHGAFGGSSLSVTAVLVPILWLFRVRVPKALVVVWGLIVLVFLYMQGGRTPVHLWVWEHVPLASSFRIAGRMSMILPILFMLVISWLVLAGDSQVRLFGKRVATAPRTLLALGALLVTGAYVFIPMSVSPGERVWPVVIREVPAVVELAWVVLSGAALASMAVDGALHWPKVPTRILLCVASLAQVALLLPYGTWVEKKADTASFAEMMEEKREKLWFRHFSGIDMVSSIVVRQSERWFAEAPLGRTYSSHLNATDNDEASRMMRKGLRPDQVVLEGYVPEAESPTAEDRRGADVDRVTLAYSSFNRLIFDVEASETASFFGLAYPYTGHWRANVNGREVQVYRANGATHAVRIPAGHSEIEFRYWSNSAFWGVVISCISLALTGVLVGSWVPRRTWGVGVATALLLLSGFLFLSWSRSLYAGENLGTVYQWVASP